MKNLVIKSMGTASFVAAMSIPNPAYACCDSFWSCAGAVATAGASCVIEELHKQADNLRKQAEQAIGLAKQNYDNYSNDINNKVSDAKASANAAIGDAPAALDASYGHIQSMLSRPKLITSVASLTNAAGDVGNTAAIAAAQMPQPNANSNRGAAKANTSGQLGVKQGSIGNSATGGSNSANAFPGGVALNLMPPDESEVRRSLEQAQQFVDTLRNQARSKHIPQASNLVSQLDRAIVNDLRGINNLVQSIVFGPIQALINGLAQFDPTGITSLIATALSGLQTAINALDNEVFNALGTLDQLVIGKVDELANPVNSLLASADLAREIEKAVTALVNTPTKAELKKLQSLLPPQPRSFYEVAALTGFHATANVGAARSFRAKSVKPIGKVSATEMKAPLAKLHAELNSPILKAKLTASPASQFNAQQFGSKTDQLLAQEFAGMSPAQKTSKQQQLLSEARTRFGKDPKALQEVERLINQGANTSLNASFNSAARSSAMQSITTPMSPASAPVIRPNAPILQPGIVR